MRQAGVLAAAGIYALEHHISRLHEDHENALRLSEMLQALNHPEVRVSEPRTNMVFVDIDDVVPSRLAERFKNENILITPSNRLRLVTHLDVSASDVDRFVEVFNRLLKSQL